MSVLAIVGLVLLALLTGAGVLFRLLMRGKVYAESSVIVDGRVVYVHLRYGSKLPKALGASATTITRTICCRDYPTSLPQTVAGRGKISKGLMAHECAHVARRQRLGAWRYWSRFAWDWMRFLPHDKQREEAEAIVMAPLILTGTCPGVDASAVLALF